MTTANLPEAQRPLFSVVIATRDRPKLFGEALDTVLAQDCSDIEVVVVDDGSSPTHLADYQLHWQRAANRLGDRFKQFSLVHRPKGHGQSYSLNFGADQAAGHYLTFLDDDDLWVDAKHLSRAAAAIQSRSTPSQAVDLYMGNQDAFAHDGRHIGTLWLGDLAAKLQATGRQPAADGCFVVNVSDLMLASGFCHVNCLVVRRDLFRSLGGMDESVRWECDRDLFLKLIDNAVLCVHHPAIVGKHHVPNPHLTNNMTTALAMVEKRLLQSIVLDRCFMRARHPAIRAHALEHKGYALKRIAQEFAGKGDWRRAAAYAKQALGIAPGLKWLGYSLYCVLKAWGQPQARLDR